MSFIGRTVVNMLTGAAWSAIAHHLHVSFWWIALAGVCGGVSLALALLDDAQAPRAREGR